MKSKVKFINIDKKYIYLVGEEKNIKNFKAVLKISKQYSKEIQKESKEKDDIQKELESLKKKHKTKKYKNIDIYMLILDEVINAIKIFKEKKMKKKVNKYFYPVLKTHIII